MEKIKNIFRGDKQPDLPKDWQSTQPLPRFNAKRHERDETYFKKYAQYERRHRRREQLDDLQYDLEHAAAQAAKADGVALEKKKQQKCAESVAQADAEAAWRHAEFNAAKKKADYQAATKQRAGARARESAESSAAKLKNAAEQATHQAEAEINKRRAAEADAAKKKAVEAEAATQKARAEAAKYKTEADALAKKLADYDAAKKKAAADAEAVKKKAAEEKASKAASNKWNALDDNDTSWGNVAANDEWIGPADWGDPIVVEAKPEAKKEEKKEEKKPDPATVFSKADDEWIISCRTASKSFKDIADGCNKIAKDVAVRVHQLEKEGRIPAADKPKDKAKEADKPMASGALPATEPPAAAAVPPPAAAAAAAADKDKDSSSPNNTPASDAKIISMKNQGKTWAQIAEACGTPWTKFDTQSRFKELQKEGKPVPAPAAPTPVLEPSKKEDEPSKRDKPKPPTPGGRGAATPTHREETPSSHPRIHKPAPSESRSCRSVMPDNEFTYRDLYKLSSIYKSFRRMGVPERDIWFKVSSAFYTETGVFFTARSIEKKINGY